MHLYSSVKEEKEEVTVKGVIASMWKLAKDSRFRYMIPQFLWTGVSIAYYSGILVYMMAETIVGSDAEKFKWSMLAMVLLGVGEILGCFFIGGIVDKFGSRTAIVCNLICILLMIASTIWYIVVY
jgi:MFS family permease